MKEAAYYKKEVQENEVALRGMIDSGRDPYDVKKFREVLGESYMMVPDSEHRLGQAVQDLRDFIKQQQQQQQNEAETAASHLDPEDEGEWYRTACEVLAEYDGTISKTSSAGVVEGEEAQDGDDELSGSPPETKVDGLAEGEIF